MSRASTATATLLFKTLGLNNLNAASKSLNSLNLGAINSSNNLNQLAKGFQQLERPAGGVLTALGALGSLASGAVGINAITNAASRSRRVFEEYQAQVVLLKQTLSNLNASNQFEAINKTVIDFVAKVPITLTEAFQAVTRILQGSGDASVEFIEKNLEAVKNLSVFYEGDLRRAIVNFSKIFTRSLEELGEDVPPLITLRDTVGQFAFQSGVAVDFLNSRFGGLAEAFAKTAIGAKQLSQQRLDTALIRIGKAISEGLTPGLIEFRKNLTNLANSISDSQLGAISNILVNVAGGLNNVLKLVIDLNKEFPKLFTTLGIGLALFQPRLLLAPIELFVNSIRTIFLGRGSAIRLDPIGLINQAFSRPNVASVKALRKTLDGKVKLISEEFEKFSNNRFVTAGKSNFRDPLTGLFIGASDVALRTDIRRAARKAIPVYRKEVAEIEQAVKQRSGIISGTLFELKRNKQNKTLFNVLSSQAKILDNQIIGIENKLDKINNIGAQAFTNSKGLIQFRAAQAARIGEFGINVGSGFISAEQYIKITKAQNQLTNEVNVFKKELNGLTTAANRANSAIIPLSNVNIFRNLKNIVSIIGKFSLITIAFGLIAVAVRTVIKNFDLFIEGINTIIDNIPGLRSIADGFQYIADIASNAFKSIQQTIGGKGILNTFDKLMQAMITGWAFTWNEMLAIFNGNLDALKIGFKGLRFAFLAAFGGKENAKLAGLELLQGIGNVAANNDPEGALARIKQLFEDIEAIRTDGLDVADVENDYAKRKQQFVEEELAYQTAVIEAIKSGSSPLIKNIRLQEYLNNLQDDLNSSIISEQDYIKETIDLRTKASQDRLRTLNRDLEQLELQRELFNKSNNTTGLLSLANQEKEILLEKAKIEADITNEQERFNSKKQRELRYQNEINTALVAFQAINRAIQRGQNLDIFAIDDIQQFQTDKLLNLLDKFESERLRIINESQDNIQKVRERYSGNTQTQEDLIAKITNETNTKLALLLEERRRAFDEFTDALIRPTEKFIRTLEELNTFIENQNNKSVLLINSGDLELAASQFSALKQSVKLLDNQIKITFENNKNLRKQLLEQADESLINQQELTDQILKLDQELNIQLADLEKRRRDVLERFIQSNFAAQIGASIREGLQSGLGNALSDIIKGVESVEDAFRNLAINIIDSIAQIFAAQAVKQFFEFFAQSQGGAGTGIFGQFLTGLLGPFDKGGRVPGPYTGKDDKLAVVHGGEGFIPAPILKDPVNEHLFELLRTGNLANILSSQLKHLPKRKAYRPSGSFAEGGVVNKTPNTINNNPIVSTVIGDKQIDELVRKNPAFFTGLQKLISERGAELGLR